MMKREIKRKFCEVKRPQKINGKKWKVKTK